jgi:predicted DsbA family dithiol-disulfide isomerase
MKRVAIDFFSDVSCPWCYVGWAALKRAAEARPEIACALSWRNFLLHPEAPPEGVDRKDYFKDRYDPEKLRAIHAALEAAAAEAEVPLNLAAPSRLPNTINAHRLIHWAAGQNRAEAAIDALFAAYWVDGRDVGALETLGEVADEIGLDGALVRELMAGDADRDAIAALHAMSVRIGVTGVPVAILNRQAVLMGAESVATYGEAIDKTAA